MCVGITANLKLYRLVHLDNNSAPSFLRSLCEIRGDWFGLRHFSGEAQLPKKTAKVQKTITDKFAQWLKNKWCKVIIVIKNHSLDIFHAF